MKSIFALPVFCLLAVSACDQFPEATSTPNNDLLAICPADELQNLVGMSGGQALAALETVETPQNEDIIFVGAAETKNPQISRGKTLVVMDRPEVWSKEEILSADVVSVQCKV